MSSIGFGSALSMHPVPAHATGEVVGDVLEAVGYAPTLAVLFVTQPLTGTFDDIADSVQRMLQPEHLVAVTTGGVLGAGSEVEDGSALALWAVRGGSVETFLLPGSPLTEDNGFGYQAVLDHAQHHGGFVYRALPCSAQSSGLVLLADADSFDVPSWLAAQNPQLPIAGARFGGPIRTRWERRQGEVRSDDALPALAASNVVYHNGTKSVGGALAVAFGREFTFRTLVSQNCRPIGQPFTVTKAERNVVYAMGGHLATAALDLTVETCDDNERMLLRQGIHLGVVVNAGVGLRRVEVDRHDAGSEVSTQFISALTVGDQDEAPLAGVEPDGFGIGDFVVHQVLGADRNAGAIAVAGSCEVGDIVQFQVTDAAAARSECLQVLAEALDLNGPMPPHHSTVGALLFPSVSRGTNFFGTEHHDAAAVAEFSTVCSAGAFCAIQLGPLGDVTGQHQNSLTIALVQAAPPRGAWSDV